MAIKISQLPELGAISSNVANAFIVLVDTDDPADYLKTKKITVDNFLKVTKEYGNTPGLYYVSKGGSDTNDGKSWDKAFLTIENALSVANTSNGEIRIANSIINNTSITVSEPFNYSANDQLITILIPPYNSITTEHWREIQTEEIAASTENFLITEANATPSII